MRQQLTTISDATSFLLNFSPVQQKGETYQLGRMKALMNRLGNPQDAAPAIHIAGTSGKSSTTYYIRGLLEARGVRTGMTTSPHITSIAERVQVGGRPLADAVFLRYLNDFIDVVEQYDDLQPTYFELLSAFAFWVFRAEQVDYMVIEVGLGGLLDATNVMSRFDKVSVITPIGLDHTEVLGETLGAIAYQKAGIINEQSIVFSARQDRTVDSVLRCEAAERCAMLVQVRPVAHLDNSVPLFQQENFALANQVADYVAERDNLRLVEAARLREVVNKTPPGRFETYEINCKTIILDGAHNPQKLSAFLESLHQQYSGPYGMLVGFVSAPKEKIRACVQLLSEVDSEFIATEYTVGQDIKGRRSVSADELANMFQTMSLNARAQADPLKGLKQLLEMKQRTVVVTGSLYLVAVVREHIVALTAER